MDRRVYLVLCVTVLLVAGVFRFYHLADRSLWLDEARVANYAGQSISENITKTRLGSSSPVAYPLLLQAMRQFADSPFAVRSISAVSSLLAIFVILMLVRVGFEGSGALIAAAILAVSPSQIRYAQEVREYSLSVLLASLMVFAFLSFRKEKNGSRIPLLVCLFLAPLVKYGLVFFAVALLAVLAFETWRLHGRTEALRRLAGATALLATGVIITVALTLRGQWGRGGMSYLDGFFFHGSMFDPGALCQFLITKIPEMMTYVTLGHGSAVLLVPVLGLLVLVRPSADRDPKLLFALAGFSVVIVAAASLAKIYPLGPIRQNLFLAPAIAVAIGGGWVALTTVLPKKCRSFATAIFLMVVLAAGTFGVIRADPYQEIEDIKTVLAGLDDRDPGDVVYVYYGAWPALRYYKVEGRPDFVFGHCHRDDPSAYLPEFRSLVGEEASRVWLVFSHANPDEMRFLLDELAPEWILDRVVNARGACLYVGRRIGVPVDDPTPQFPGNECDAVGG
ncbi:MAG: glycosyltransferase family 39 protein [Acidobacteriota bacterium]